MDILITTAVRAVHNRMFALLKQSGVGFAGAYYCHHLQQDGCRCRKPRAGLVERACADLGREKESLICVVRDKACDMLLARNLDVPSALIRSGAR